MAEKFDAAGFAASLNDPIVVEEEETFDDDGFGAAIAGQSQLKTSIDQAVTSSPDEYANVVRLSERTRLPTDVVEGGGDDLKQRERVHDVMSDINGGSTQVLNRKMQDIDFAKASHDDSQTLSAWELLSKKFEAGQLLHEEGVAGTQVRRTRSVEAQANVDAIKQRVKALGIPEADGALSFLAEASEILGQMTAGFAQTKLGVRVVGGATIGGTLGLVGGPLAPVTSTAGAIAGAVAGGISHLVLDSFEVEGGLAYLEQIEEGIDPDVAQFTSLAVGVVNAGLEIAGETAILAPFAKAAKELFKSGLSKALKRATVKDAALEAAKVWTKSTGTEVLTEVMQESVNIAATEIAKAFSEGDFESITGEEIEDRLSEIAIKTFKGMAVLGLGGGTVSFAVDVNRVRKAKLQQDVIIAMGDNAQASKLRERLPRKYREFVEEVKKNGTVDDVLVNTEKMVELFQSPVGEEFDATLADLRAKVDEAVVNTEDFVAIPLEDYQTFIAGTDAHTELSKDIKFHFDDMSLNEALENEADLQDSFREEFAAVSREAGEQEVSEDVANQVFDRVRTQLQTAGRATTVAGQEALAHKAFARVLQKRYGMSAEQVGALYGGLEVKGELPEVLRGRPKNEVDLILERVRSGKDKTEGELFGQSLVDFVREEGIDIDSPELTELLNFDIDKNLKPFQKKTLREGGRRLDDLALAAQEAGFFSEIDPTDRIDINTLIDAIGEGLQGRNRFVEGVGDEAELGRRAAAADLAAELDRRDIDIDLSNDEIIAQLEDQEVSDDGALFQSSADVPVAELDFEQVDLPDPGNLVTIEEKKFHNAKVRLLDDLLELGRINDDLLFELHGLKPGGNTSVIDEFAENTNNGSFEEYLENEDRFAEDDGDNYKVEEFSFSGDLFDLAVLAKGETESVELAGYILPDGVMLDFSAGQGGRFEDHRELNIPVKSIPDKGQSSGTNDMIAFQKAGAMRIDANSNFIDMEVMPTNRQLRKIEDVFDEDGLGRVSVADGDRKADFTVSSPDQAAGLIRRFYRGEDITKDEFFQGAEGQEGVGGETPRGSIQFLPDDQVIINLKEAADVSTFLHESAHFFVDVLSKIAPQSPEAQRDLDAMMKFVGATDASEFALVANQEKLARGFEAYLREGKAPSIELQDAFARFKSWLLRVYEDLLKLNIELTPDIREVFDRMLATDEEIEAAAQFNKFVVNQNLLGVITPAEGRQLIISAQKARDTASEELLKRKIKELEREETKAWKAERAKIRLDVKVEVDNRPPYRAIDLLRDKENNLKMARADVEDLRGEEIFGQLPRGLTGKDGVHPDIVADLVGLQSGDQLLLLLINSAKNKTERNQIIDEETDAVMNERHGSLNENQRHAIEAANEAVFSEDQAKFIALEAKMLNKLAGETLRAAAERDVADLGADTAKADRDAVAAAAAAVAASEGDIGQVADLEFQKKRAKASVTGRRAQSAGVRQAREALNVSADVVKEQAKRIVASMKMNDALAIGRFTSASLRFGKQAALAIARRDYAEAVILKQRQLLNHYMAIESRKVKKEIDSTIKYFGKFKGRANKSTAIDPAYVEQIKTILAAYQFTARLSPRRGTILELQAMNEWIIAKQEDDTAILQIPPAIMQATETTHWRDMTLDDIRGVEDAVRNLDVQGRNKLKLLTAKGKAELQATVNDMSASLQLNFQGTGGPPSPSLTKFERKVEWVQRRFSLRKVESMLREWDGFKPGVMQDFIFAPISAAAVNLETRRRASALKMKGMFEKYSVKEATRMFSRKIQIPEIGMAFTKESIIAVALNVGNDDNKSKMMKNYGWNEAQIDAILDHLDERDWNFIQDSWDYIETFWEETKKLDMVTKGFVAPKIEAQTVVTKFGEFRGGYYPLKYDSRTSDKATAQSADDLYKSMLRGSLGRPSTNQSRTKDRAKSVKGLKVRLDLGVLLEGIDETMHDLSYRKVALDVSKILSHSTLTEVIRNTYGPAKLGILTDWIRDSVAGDISHGDNYSDQFFGFLRRRTALMTMGYKVSTFIVQPLGYIQTAARFIQDTGSVRRGLYYTAKGVSEFYGSPQKIKDNIKFIYKKSPMMKGRGVTFDRELNDVMKGIKAGPTAKYQASLLMMIGQSQKTVDMPTWMAAYNYSLDSNPAVGKKGAARHADSVVRLTQGGGLNVDLAAIQRGPESQKILAMYMTFFNSMQNMLEDEFKLTRREGFKRAHLLVTNIFLLTFLPANLFPALFAAFGVGGPDEDEGWLMWMLKNWVTFGVAGIPIARDAISSVVSGFPFQISPVASTLKSVVEFSNQASQGDLDKALFKAAVKAVSIIPGVPPLPSSQISLTGEYFWDYTHGEKESFNVIEAFIARDY